MMEKNIIEKSDIREHPVYRLVVVNFALILNPRSVEKSAKRGTAFDNPPVRGLMSTAIWLHSSDRGNLDASCMSSDNAERGMAVMEPVRSFPWRAGAQEGRLGGLQLRRRPAARPVLAAPRAPVGPTWPPGGEARRVSWEQRKGPPCGATGRALGGASWAPLDAAERRC